MTLILMPNKFPGLILCDSTLCISLTCPCKIESLTASLMGKLQSLVNDENVDNNIILFFNEKKFLLMFVEVVLNLYKFLTNIVITFLSE